MKKLEIRLREKEEELVVERYHAEAEKKIKAIETSEAAEEHHT